MTKALLTAGLVLLSPALFSQTSDLTNVEIHALPVQGNVFMLVGAGGNITVQAGADGVLLVDTEYAPLADKILAATSRKNLRQASALYHEYKLSIRPHRRQ